MSDDLNEFLSTATSDTGSNQETGGQLRAKLEQALALLRTTVAERDTLKSNLAEQSVAGTWTELKVPDVIRKFYTGDKTPEAIKSWWEESKGFFNITDGEPAGQQGETPEQVAARAQQQAFQQAASLGTDLQQGGYDAAIAKAEGIKGLTGEAFQAAKQAFYEAAQIPKF